ncbi:acyltransferase family protein [Streptomyces sp. B21-083]|uniref:acyltransferase family protein n=1 Tax=Streptomyces sp. B21-083 TaxID=3039410 RepID=UPI002FF1EE1F
MNEELYDPQPPHPAASSRYETGARPGDPGGFPFADRTQYATAGGFADRRPVTWPAFGVEGGPVAFGGPVGGGHAADVARFPVLLADTGPGAAPGPVSGRGLEGEASGRRFLAVDGLRGAAVLAVLAHDTGVGGPYFTWTGAGVDVLLVLTGFLATLPLLRGATATGGTGVAGFLVRRAKRLVPALLVVAALILTVWWTLGSARAVLDPAGPLGHGSWARWLRGRPLGVVPTVDSPLAPLRGWDLVVGSATAWALLLACLGLLARRRLAPVALVAALLAGVWATASVSGALPGAGGLTGVRSLALAAGAVAACLVHLAERGGRAVSRPVGVLLTVTGLAAATALAVSAVLRGGGQSETRYVVAVVLSAAVLTAVLCGGRGLLVRLLSGELVTEVGRMSYSLFLLHLPVYWLLERGQPGLGPLGLFLVGGGVTWFLSLLVHYLLVERLAARSWRRGRSAR